MIAPAPRKPMPAHDLSGDPRRVDPDARAEVVEAVRRDEREQRGSHARRRGACATPPAAREARARARSRRRAPPRRRGGAAPRGQPIGRRCEHVRERRATASPEASRSRRSPPWRARAARRASPARTGRARRSPAPRRGVRRRSSRRSCRCRRSSPRSSRGRGAGRPRRRRPRPRRPSRGTRERPKRSSARIAATYAPQIAAQRVPPSAWRTSQSSHSVRSPSASKSATARTARPINRWISTVRPCCFPRDASRWTRSPVDAGRSEYSAVIQPRPGRGASAGCPPRPWPCTAPSSAPA